MFSLKTFLFKWSFKLKRKKTIHEMQKKKKETHKKVIFIKILLSLKSLRKILQVVLCKCAEEKWEECKFSLS